MLDVKDINLYYGAAQALRGVSLVAEPGKVTCVLGRNGVGKTSLLRAMVGQQPISSGAILFEGQDINALKPYERARRGISFVPQGREIFPLLTVEENLRTGFAPLKRDERSIPDDVFSLFPVLQSMLGRRGGDLSGGQQQQLAIGRALVMRPETPAARRADRRHPAVDHQGHRPGDLLPAQPRHHRHRPGGAVSRFRLRAWRPVRRDGSWRGDFHLRPRQSRPERNQPGDGAVAAFVPSSTAVENSVPMSIRHHSIEGRALASEAETSSRPTAPWARSTFEHRVSRPAKPAAATSMRHGSLRVRFPSPEHATPVRRAGQHRRRRGRRRPLHDIRSTQARHGADADDGGGRENLSLAWTRRRHQRVAARAGASAHLAWLPQETILFDQARLSRRIDIDLHEDASLLLAEIVVFGRTAMDERMNQRRLSRPLAAAPRRQADLRRNTAARRRYRRQAGAARHRRRRCRYRDRTDRTGRRGDRGARSRSRIAFRRRGRHLGMERFCARPLLR